MIRGTSEKCTMPTIRIWHTTPLTAPHQHLIQINPRSAACTISTAQDYHPNVWSNSSSGIGAASTPALCNNRSCPASAVRFAICSNSCSRCKVCIQSHLQIVLQQGCAYSVRHPDHAPVCLWLSFRGTRAVPHRSRLLSPPNRAAACAHADWRCSNLSLADHQCRSHWPPPHNHRWCRAHAAGWRCISAHAQSACADGSCNCGRHQALRVRSMGSSHKDGYTMPLWPIPLIIVTVTLVYIAYEGVMSDPRPLIIALGTMLVGGVYF